MLKCYENKTFACLFVLNITKTRWPEINENKWVIWLTDNFQGTVCLSSRILVLVQTYWYENEFDLHEISPAVGAHFQMYGFARGLILTQRQKASLKWPVKYLDRCRALSLDRYALAMLLALSVRNVQWLVDLDGDRQRCRGLYCHRKPKTKTERRADKQSTESHFRVTKFHYSFRHHS